MSFVIVYCMQLAHSIGPVYTWNHGAIYSSMMQHTSPEIGFKVSLSFSTNVSTHMNCLTLNHISYYKGFAFVIRC